MTLNILRKNFQKEELERLLSELTIQIKSNKWYRNRAEFGKIKNDFSDALFEKYKQCVYKFETLAPESQVHYYKNIIKEQSFRKFYQKNIGLFKRVGLFSLLFLLAFFFIKFIFSIVGIFFWISLIIGLFIMAFIVIRKDQENVKYQKNHQE